MKIKSKTKAKKKKNKIKNKENKLINQNKNIKRMKSIIALIIIKKKMKKV